MKFAILVLFLPLLVQGQSEFDPKPEPKAFERPVFHGDHNQTGIHSVIRVLRTYENGFRDDTLSVFEYNAKGHITSSVSYNTSNKFYSKEFFHYDSLDRCIERRTQYVKRENQVTKYYYNRFNKYDSVATDYWKSRDYLYYEDSLLIAKRRYYNGKVNSSFVYSYSGGLLKESQFLKNEDSEFGKTNCKITSYSYDSINRLISKYTVQKVDTPVYHFKTTYYHYQNGKLSSEEELTYDKQLIRHTYTYDSSGLLLEMRTIWNDTSFCHVTFEYKKGLWSTVRIRTNSYLQRSKFHHSYIPPYMFPVYYEIKYMYDERHNLVSEKHFVNGKFWREEEYFITYFD
ncbi:MAG: hypothetical protein EP332_13110 [Bacteroidetes bacterium]|nr:MAG: hypothetical protein EP332_13110 [Bacteroidota bacterium]